MLTHQRILKLALLATFAAGLLGGCANHPINAVVLLDQTLPEDQRPAELAVAQAAANQLESGDKLMVRGIGTQSGRDCDVLLSHAMPDNSIAARQDRPELEARLKGLKLAPIAGKGTDLVTGLAASADELARCRQPGDAESSAPVDVVIVVSDLRPDGHDVPNELAQRKVQFASGTRLICFMVPAITDSEKGQNAVDVARKLESQWQSWFGKMGVKVAATDLVRPAESTGEALTARLEALFTSARKGS